MLFYTVIFQELALGYANRSAVLFQMKEYQLCIRDITRAFNYSYPNNLMYKLFERKARCQRALKDFARALESMKEAQMWMRYSNLNETKSVSFKKDITKQIEFLQDKVNAMAMEEIENMDNFGPHVSGCLAKPPPKLEGASNVLPCARADIVIKYHPDKGRYVNLASNVQASHFLIPTGT